MFQTYSTSDYYDSNSLCFRSILLRAVMTRTSAISILSCSGCYDSPILSFIPILLQITLTQVILPILTYSTSDLYCLENYFEAPFTTVRH